MNILSLSQLLKNPLLVRLKHFFFVLYHLSVLVVVVAQNVIDLLYCQCAIHPFNILKLIRDEIVLVHDFVHEVVGRDIFAVDDHVVDQVELQEGD